MASGVPIPIVRVVLLIVVATGCEGATSKSDCGFCDVGGTDGLDPWSSDGLSDGSWPGDTLKTTDLVKPATPCELAIAGQVNHCELVCESASDCPRLFQRTDTAFDADNWVCLDGGCQFLGCTNQQECETSEYWSTAHEGAACVELPGRDAECLPNCTEAADCPFKGIAGAISDEDNYVCVLGACIWLGCISDQECYEMSQSSILYGLTYRCEHLPMELHDGSEISFGECVRVCDCDSDCVPSGSYLPTHEDQDNWVCCDGTCRYLGCHSMQECQDKHGGEYGDWKCVSVTE